MLRDAVSDQGKRPVPELIRIWWRGKDLVMKKISKTKLALRAESLRHLANQELAGAQGGMPPQTQTGCAGDCDTFRCTLVRCGGTQITC